MINWHSFFFLLSALVACAFAIGVAVSSNIVRMAVYLVVSLGAVAGLYFLAGADFVGAMQLMIYVGGTLVLLVFGVMLTAQGPFVSMTTSRVQQTAGALVGGALLFVLLVGAFSVGDWIAPPSARRQAELPESATTTPLGMGLLGMRVDQLDQPNATLRRGMSGYLLGFEIISVHLVVVLVGAAYLARARKRPTDDTNEEKSSL
jgi:NADH:ubiquinone oxidoreductase subunit 6 (subunit J)